MKTLLFALFGVCLFGTFHLSLSRRAERAKAANDPKATDLARLAKFAGAAAIFFLAAAILALGFKFLDA
jgi:hypothetical protein